MWYTLNVDGKGKIRKRFDVRGNLGAINNNIMNAMKRESHSKLTVISDGGMGKVICRGRFAPKNELCFVEYILFFLIQDYFAATLMV